MINSILGKIVFKDEQQVVLEAFNVGFEVFLSSKNLEIVKIGETKKIYTFLFISQNNIELYGFLNRDELESFKILNGISGIGPKTALSLASLGTIKEIQEILERGELPPYIKGIGQKKLQKIILELTGRIKEVKKSRNEEDKEVIEALVKLGIPRQRAKESLSKISPEIKTTEEKIKEALKNLGQ